MDHTVYCQMDYALYESAEKTRGLVVKGPSLEHKDKEVEEDHKEGVDHHHETKYPPLPPTYASLYYKEEEEEKDLKTLVLDLQSRMQHNFEWMALQIQEVSRSNQYLFNENNLLRTRQEERQHLVHELKQQHQIALTMQTTTIQNQLQALINQQHEIITALSKFAVSFDSVPKS